MYDVVVNVRCSFGCKREDDASVHVQNKNDASCGCTMQ